MLGHRFLHEGIYSKTSKDKNASVDVVWMVEFREEDKRKNNRDGFAEVPYQYCNDTSILLIIQSLFQGTIQ